MFPFRAGSQDINQYYSNLPEYQDYSSSFPLQSRPNPWGFPYDHNLRPYSWYSPFHQFHNCFYNPSMMHQHIQPLSQIGSHLSAIQVSKKAEVKQEEIKPREEAVEQQSGLYISQKWRQKFGRNISSNIFHMALKKVTSHEFIVHINEAIKTNNLLITVQEFQLKLQEKVKLGNSYISNKNIKKILVGNPIGATRNDIDFRKLLRILIRIYLHNYHIPHIYSSGKIRKQSRGLHLQAMRKLIKRLRKL